MSAILFGKLPAHGDFISRGLLAGERDRLDDWLSTEMADTRAAFGKAFEDLFDTAPPWRCAWAGEGHWSAGALAPSVDAVGRRFPLLVARDGLRAEEARAVAEACEAALYDALAEGWTADQLVEVVAGLAPQAGEVVEAESWWCGTVELAGRYPPGLLRAVLAQAREAA